MFNCFQCSLVCTFQRLLPRKPKDFVEEILSLPSVEAEEQTVRMEQEASMETNIGMEEDVYTSKGKEKEEKLSKEKKKMSKQDL